MSEKSSEKSEMSAVEFMQFGLQSKVAPPHLGSVKTRLRHATSVMLKHDRKQANRKKRWTANRVKDIWFADERVSPRADEIRDVEVITGLRYGREELHETDDLIAACETLLAGPKENLAGALASMLRAVAGAAHRSRASNGG